MARFKIILATFILVIGVYLFFTQLIKNNPTNNPQTNNSLKTTVENALTGTKGTYSVAIKNLKTGESYYANENRIYPAGSLYKLWVMATVFNKIQDQTLDENRLLSEDITTLNNKFNIDDDLAEQTEGTISLTVHDALNQMIVISHNYAALLLTEKVKLSTVATFLRESNLNNSKVGTSGEIPTTTASDIALFFEKLYKGELGSQENTDKMISLLKNQQLNNKIPKYLPPETEVAHKTGEIGWSTHDAGIVYTPFGNYIMVILSESDSPMGAEDRIAQISQATYEYFKNKLQTTDM